MSVVPPILMAIPIGRRLELISDTAIEIYRFNAGDTVTATLGTRDGPVCAPVFVYTVLSADSIRLVHSDETFTTWTRIAIDGDILRVECDGKRKTFKIE